MNNLKYTLLRIISKLPFCSNLILHQLKKEGCKIGLNTHLFSNVSPEEPYLVEIGNNCTISTDVSFLTHDASIGLYLDRDKFSDICGKIIIGDNCFIGNHVILLYGVSIPDNTIVAAGSVVTKSFTQPNCIIGGNPAKVIGNVPNFVKKSTAKALCLHGLDSNRRKINILNSNKLIQR